MNNLRKREEGKEYNNNNNIKGIVILCEAL